MEPEYRRAERPEEVQTRVSETLEAMMLLGPAFSGDASVSAEHLYATCSARACFCVANKVMQTKRKTMLVCRRWYSLQQLPVGSFANPGSPPLGSHHPHAGVAHREHSNQSLIIITFNCEFWPLIVFKSIAC